MLHTGCIQVIEIEGKRYKLSRLTRGLMKKWLVWADSQLDNPLVIASRNISKCANNQIKELLIDMTSAMATKRFSFFDPPIMSLWSDYNGQFKLFCLLLEEFHFEIPNKECKVIFDKVFNFERIKSYAMGKFPVDLIRLPDGTTSSPVEERALFEELGFISPKPNKEQKMPDWADIDRQLAEASNYVLTPLLIDNLTLPEIQVMLKQDKNKKDDKNKRKTANSDDYDMINAWGQLTPENKLQLAFRMQLDKG